jgi:hypothetical protein
MQKQTILTELSALGPTFSSTSSFAEGQIYNFKFPLYLPHQIHGFKKTLLPN